MTFFKDLAGALSLWRFWMFDAWLEMAVRHRYSVLGLLWLLLPTVVFVAVVGTIFRQVMSADASYFLYITTGLVIWGPINHVLNGAPNCYRANRAFVLIGGTPLLTFNLQLVFFAVLVLAVQFLLILGAVLVFRPPVSANVATVIPALAMLFLLLFPASVALALIGTRFEDFGEAVRSIVRILFLATPVIWSISDQARYEVLKPFLYLNPFFFLIELVRAPLMGHAVNPAYWLYLSGYVVAAWIFALVTYRYLRDETTLWL